MVRFPVRQLGQRHHHLSTRFEPAVKRLDGPDRGNQPLAPEPWQAKISERKLRVGCGQVAGGGQEDRILM
jgi:hypothetical protein